MKKFKPGDIIRPIPGKSLSNYKKLKTLEELVVISYDTYSSTHMKKGISVKIQKGCTDDAINWQTYVQGQTITVFEDGFELIVPEEEDYSIF